MESPNTDSLNTRSWASRLQVIENRDTKGGRVFENCVLAVVGVSLISFAVGTMPSLSPGTQSTLQVIEVVTILLFSVEYCLRIYVARDRGKYLCSFYGVLDLVVILSYYLSLAAFDGRILRAVRLLRLFTILKSFRYYRATNRLMNAVVIVKEELVIFSVLSGVLLYLAAAGIWYFESQAQPDSFGSMFDGLWWAVITLTTVGYGDVYPVTVGGRVFTFLLLMIGLGIIAIPPGIIASALSKARQEQDRQTKDDRPET